MEQNEQHQHYSDLEVAPTQTPNQQPDYSYPEAVPRPTGTDKIVHTGPDGQKAYIGGDNTAPEAVFPGQHQQYPSHYNAVPQNDHAADGAAGGAAAAAGGAAATGKAGQRMCGLKRRTFWIVLGVVIAVVIAAGVAGGVAGGISARNTAMRHSGSSGSSSGSSDNANVMGLSTLTAANWTDSKNYVHRTVFFQDPWNSVLARRWDSQNKTWTTSNVTAVLNNSPIPMNPQPGTSLATATLDWPNAYQIKLFFLDPTNVVRCVSANAPVVTPDLWQNDTLSEARLTTYPGSRLAAAWQRCNATNCVGVWAVAYQGPNAGAINVANYTDYTSPLIPLDGNKVAGNSTLALVPQFQGRQEGLGLLTQSYGSGTTGSMQINNFNQTWKRSRKLTPLFHSGVPDWHPPPFSVLATMNESVILFSPSPSSIPYFPALQANSSPTASDVMSSIPLPASQQHAAVAKWGSWDKTLVITLLDDGTLRGTWWQGTGSQNALSTITLDGSGAPSNPQFSAIAMTLDARFYGIVDDAVHEYEVDGTDPSTMHYVGQVYP